jgi:hypothetical protein
MFSCILLFPLFDSSFPRLQSLAFSVFLEEDDKGEGLKKLTGRRPSLASPRLIPGLFFGRFLTDLIFVAPGGALVVSVRLSSS